MTATDCPDHARLTAFHEGTLPTDDHLQVARHIRNCPACRERVLADGAEPPARPLPVYPDPCEPDGTAETSAFAAAHTPARPASWVDVIGPYRIRRLIGRGGMGAVYEAVHDHLGRSVALKVLPRPVAVDPESVARFKREWRAVGKLNHPNVVRATDAGTEDGVPYLAMELVDGVDLCRLLTTSAPLPAAEAGEIARQAACGLAHAHERGIVHRDVKPSNLMLTPDGVVKVLDLGLAVCVSAVGRTDEKLTASTVLGTHEFMAPEQWEDPSDVGVAVDVYGLGCVLFQALTGRLPFPETQFVSPHALRRAHLTVAPPDVTALRPNTPPALADLVRRMLAKRPADRPTAADVADTLRRLTPDPPPLGRLLQLTRVPPDSRFRDGDVTAVAPVLPDVPTAATVKAISNAETITIPAVPPPPPAPPVRETRAWVLLAALALFTLVGGLIWIVSGAGR